MRIGFDATVLASATRYTGAGQYALKLLPYMARLSPHDDFVLYGDAQGDVTHGFPANVTWRRLPHLPLGKLSTLATHLARLPRIVGADGIDVFHAPMVHTRPSLPPIPRSLGCPLVVTLHDVIPLTFYGHEGPAMPWRMRRFYEWNLGAVRKAAQVITVSETSRAEILEALDLRPERVVAIHNGIDFGRAGRDGSCPDGVPADVPYVLFAGSFEPRKNLPLMLRAFEEAVGEGLPHHLVLVVDSRSGHAQAALRELVELSCADRLHFVSGLDEGSLRAVYEGADIFVFPSLSEGFGFPPLQAMTCGVPVIASDIPALREVLGGAARYVDPRSIRSISAALLELAGDCDLRERLAAGGPAQAALYRWEDTARRTLEVYRAAVGRGAAVAVTD